MSQIPTAKPRSFNVKHISKWTVDSTVEWLTAVGYKECGPFFKDQRINGIALLMLDEDDLKEVIKHNVGQRKNLYHMIRLIQIRYNRYMNKMKSMDSFFTRPSSGNDSNSSNNSSSDDSGDENALIEESKIIKQSFLLIDNADLNNNYDVNLSKNKNTNKSTPNSNNQKVKNKNSIVHRHLLNETDTNLKNNGNNGSIYIKKKKSKNSSKTNGSLLLEDNDKSDSDMPNFCENCLKKFDSSPYSNFSQTNNNNSPIRCYKGERRKTLVSMIYLFLIGLWTSFILTVVHDRVPDMEKYPPLPDLILDNVPLISWAFFASEAIGIILLSILFIILIFHKYRIIIFRRMCSLGGTIFLLRSITMLITSLSVPGNHIQCSAETYGSLTNKLYGAWNILSGVGLYASGVRTCGDYMFSGHTVWITLTSHFISEYTPITWYLLHTSTWIMNAFGLFFILGSHEHYSIDVFVGFYITSRLFLYYHSLANNKALFQRDHKRVKIWFPMLSYFESNIHSIVPNEYQCPPNPFHYLYKLIKTKFKQMKKVASKQKLAADKAK